MLILVFNHASIPCVRQRSNCTSPLPTIPSSWSRSTPLEIFALGYLLPCHPSRRDIIAFAPLSSHSYPSAASPVPAPSASPPVSPFQTDPRPEHHPSPPSRSLAWRASPPSAFPRHPHSSQPPLLPPLLGILRPASSSAPFPPS